MVLLLLGMVLLLLLLVIGWKDDDLLLLLLLLLLPSISSRRPAAAVNHALCPVITCVGIGLCEDAAIDGTHTASRAQLTQERGEEGLQLFQ